MYQHWKAHFDDQTFSLDLFCNQYFQSCKKSNLFDSFIKIFINYFFDRHDIFSYTELFTQMIFFRFENDNLKNEELWKLWKESMLSLDKHNGELFFNHVKIHINRVIEKKAYDFAKFEVARFENRAAFNMVIIEASCKNCHNEYIYFPVPIINYLPYLFYEKSNDAYIYEYARLYDTRCQKCNNSDFSFIII